MPGQHVAVVGGGVFGATTAAELARDGHDVELFERHGDLLQGASGINQYRLHRGYHYPRSRETAANSKIEEASFRRLYNGAMLDDADHWYGISTHDSKTSPEGFLAFCDEIGLEYELAEPSFARPGSLSLAVRVREALFDPDRLRELCWEGLRETGTKVHLGTEATPELLDGFDTVVLATYANLNVLARDRVGVLEPYQFEVCEKPVVRMPPTMARQSMVVMDGPFCCFDPLGRTGLHVWGNVEHAIHHRSVGDEPEVPDELRAVLDRGIVRDPSMTKFSLFLDSAREFLTDRELEGIEHVGSMFTVRTVQPNRDADDARPTLVRRLDPRTVLVFSGKIGTCVQAARDVRILVDQEAHERRPPV